MHQHAILYLRGLPTARLFLVINSSLLSFPSEKTMHAKKKKATERYLIAKNFDQAMS